MDSFNHAARVAADQAADLVIRKQRDYGPNNILNCPVGAEMGVAVRLYDKIARLANLLSSGEDPEFETVEDTVNDIIGYGLVLKMVLDGNFTLPLEDEPPF